MSQGIEAGGNDRVPLFIVHKTTTLITAIEKMAATKTHRVWVCEGENLVGVVSLSDVIRVLNSA